MNVLAELRRRNVIRMAGLYLVGAWLIVQIAETLLPIFHTPDWVLQALVVLLALGFIPALVFSWVFELTPDGVRRDAEVPPSQSVATATGRRMDLLIVLGLVAVVALVAADRYWPATERAVATNALGVDETAGAASEPVSSQGVGAPPSIAVLPFSNLSSDPEQEYFSDGMTEELLNVLAKIPGLNVAARTSVFAFKGKGGDVRQIGSDLGVSHIIEGSVRRDGEAIRVTAQLVRVSDGFHVWSETYDRKLESVFALQDELANRVASALKESLGMVAPAAPRSSITPEAYDLYLKGRALLRSRNELQSAINHFQASVELEPAFAAGWSSLSLSYDVAYWYLEDLSPSELEQLADRQMSAAERAAAIDPDNAAVNHALGNVARRQFRYAEAERRYLQAMQIDPGYSDVREDYAELLYQVGRTQDAMAAAQQLVRLDPYFGIGWVRVYEAALQLDLRTEVEAAIERLRVLTPNYPISKFGLLNYAVTWGRADEARAELAAIARRWPDEVGFAETLLPWALEGKALDEARLQEALAQTPMGDFSYYLIARPDLAEYAAQIRRRGSTIQSFYFAYLNDSVAKGHVLLRDPLAKSGLERYGFVSYWREKGWPPICQALDDNDFECGIDRGGAN